ncbi:MAG TPA: hypothetical protein VF808_05040 [Ktedonobacterales bacterium]
MASDSDAKQSREKIVGQSRSLSDNEAENITQMIRDAQQSARQLSIPREDLDEQATTAMRPEVAAVVEQSHVLDILGRFNRDYLYGLGRFDEYSQGLLLKWGDGYSRKHIWITVEDSNLVFETSHERTCSRPYCRDGRHVFAPDQWRDPRLLNEELGEQLRRPVYERSED